MTTCSDSSAPVDKGSAKGKSCDKNMSSDSFHVKIKEEPVDTNQTGTIQTSSLHTAPPGDVLCIPLGQGSLVDLQKQQVSSSMVTTHLEQGALGKSVPPILQRKGKRDRERATKFEKKMIEAKSPQKQPVANSSKKVQSIDDLMRKKVKLLPKAPVASVASVPSLSSMEKKTQPVLIGTPVRMTRRDHNKISNTSTSSTGKKCDTSLNNGIPRIEQVFYTQWKSDLMEVVNEKTVPLPVPVKKVLMKDSPTPKVFSRFLKQSLKPSEKPGQPLSHPSQKKRKRNPIPCTTHISTSSKSETKTTSATASMGSSHNRPVLPKPSMSCFPTASLPPLQSNLPFINPLQLSQFPMVLQPPLFNLSPSNTLLMPAAVQPSPPIPLQMNLPPDNQGEMTDAILKPAQNVTMMPANPNPGEGAMINCVTPVSIANQFVFLPGLPTFQQAPMLQPTMTMPLSSPSKTCLPASNVINGSSCPSNVTNPLQQTNALFQTALPVGNISSNSFCSPQGLLTPPTAFQIYPNSNMCVNMLNPNILPLQAMPLNGTKSLGLHQSTLGPMQGDSPVALSPQTGKQTSPKKDNKPMASAKASNTNTQNTLLAVSISSKPSTSSSPASSLSSLSSSSALSSASPQKAKTPLLASSKCEQVENEIKCNTKPKRKIEQGGTPVDSVTKKLRLIKPKFDPLQSQLQIPNSAFVKPQFQIQSSTPRYSKKTNTFPNIKLPTADGSRAICDAASANPNAKIMVGPFTREQVREIAQKYPASRGGGLSKLQIAEIMRDYSTIPSNVDKVKEVPLPESGDKTTFPTVKQEVGDSADLASLHSVAASPENSPSESKEIQSTLESTKPQDSDSNCSELGNIAFYGNIELLKKALIKCSVRLQRLNLIEELSQNPVKCPEGKKVPVGRCKSFPTAGDMDKQRRLRTRKKALIKLFHSQKSRQSSLAVKMQFNKSVKVKEKNSGNQGDEQNLVIRHFGKKSVESSHLNDCSVDTRVTKNHEESCHKERLSSGEKVRHSSRIENKPRKDYASMERGGFGLGKLDLDFNDFLVNDKRNRFITKDEIKVQKKETESAGLLVNEKGTKCTIQDKGCENTKSLRLPCSDKTSVECSTSREAETHSAGKPVAEPVPAVQQKLEQDTSYHYSSESDSDYFDEKEEVARYEAQDSSSKMRLLMKRHNEVTMFLLRYNNKFSTVEDANKSVHTCNICKQFKTNGLFRLQKHLRQLHCLK